MRKKTKQLLYQVYMTGLWAQITINNQGHLSDKELIEEAIKRAEKFAAIDPLRKPFRISKRTWIVPVAAIKIGDPVLADNSEEAEEKIAQKTGLTKNDLIAELFW